MADKILPDTNIVSALIKGESGIADKFDAADEVIVALTVLGELYFGAEKSPKREEYSEKQINLPQTTVCLRMTSRRQSNTALSETLYELRGDQPLITIFGLRHWRYSTI